MMGKMYTEQANNELIVTNKLSRPEAVNERELNAIAAGMMDGLLPVYAEKVKKDIFVKCRISGMVSLRSYFAGAVTKELFLDAVLHLIRLVKECERNHMNAGNLCLNLDYVFIDPQTKNAKCIFWPVVNNHNARHPSVFFQELPFDLIFSRQEDNAYVSEYLHFFKSSTPFAINAFDRLVLALSGRESGNLRMPSDSPTYRGEQKNTGNIAYDPLQDGTISEEQSPLREETEKQFSDDATVSGTGLYANGTVGDRAGEPQNASVYLCLLREKTNDRVVINKPIVRIGKDSQLADFFVSDNSAISRIHADIIKKDDRTYIIDRNSTNKTRVNGQIIPPEQEIEIVPGAKIRLADEDFILTRRVH
jgi:hypothetical protein